MFRKHNLSPPNFHLPRRKTLNRRTPKILIFLALLILSGCATSSVNKAVKKGATAMDAKEIFNLVNDNTLHLVASDFDAHVFYSPDGTLAASSAISNNLDNGSWDIKNDDKLCIKFRVWYFSDVNCYSVYEEPASNKYLLFTTNGSLAYTATGKIGNSKNLKVKTKKATEATFVRSNLERDQGTSRPHSAPVAASAAQADPLIASGPGASSKEISHTVKSIAKDCPGCNLKEADLRRANLIGANLKGADLRGADLSRANLRRANLEGADLSGATLLSTNLPGANLRDADLTGADFTGSNLIKADLTGATVDKTILDNTLQEGVKGL